MKAVIAVAIFLGAACFACGQPTGASTRLPGASRAPTGPRNSTNLPPPPHHGNFSGHSSNFSGFGGSTNRTIKAQNRSGHSHGGYQQVQSGNSNNFAQMMPMFMAMMNNNGANGKQAAGGANNNAALMSMMAAMSSQNNQQQVVQTHGGGSD